MIRLFTGENLDVVIHGSVVARTFDALRVWAIIRPKEMAAWIKTIDDPALRKALTWLLNHPMGADSKS